MLDNEIIKNRQIKNQILDLIIQKRKELLKYKDAVLIEFKQKEKEIIEFSKQKGYDVYICQKHNYPFYDFCPICEGLKNV